MSPNPPLSGDALSAEGHVLGCIGSRCERPTTGEFMGRAQKCKLYKLTIALIRSSKGLRCIERTSPFKK
ncbi:hypothetical protein DKX38_030141 (chloroplast) [Salix brachista]|uniref:Uncharacterized protein n=1 Tax=Salix brachista TaxID=2182728 RepID=A0A5N5IXP7_9ROSI|nr:hypothetical protein DKX38_030141 [Salix brachista]